MFHILAQHYNTFWIQGLINITLIFPVVWSITTFVTVPIAPFVYPSATSILVVIIILAFIFTVKTFHRLPVSHGLVGIVTFASSV